MPYRHPSRRVRPVPERPNPALRTLHHAHVLSDVALEAIARGWRPRVAHIVWHDVWGRAWAAACHPW